MVNWPLAFGLWWHSTLWWEHMLEEVHFMVAWKQRERQEGIGPNIPNDLTFFH